MILGTMLVLAALSLFLWNRNEDRRAGAAAERILPRIVERINAAGSAETGDLDPSAVLPADPFSTEMTEAEIDGYVYIGYLSIPALGLELPVMTDWSYPQLKVSPCRYYGSTKTQDLVIAAHSYARHFGNIKSLSVGDPVAFTDMDGETTFYEVAEIDILPPAAVEEMTGSGYALTLFTCTYGGQNRVTVRCDLSEQK